MRVSRRVALASAGVLMLSPVLLTGARAAGRNPAGGQGQTGCNDGQIFFSPTTIWPPDHSMHTVTVTYVDKSTATSPSDSGDNDGDMITLTVNKITDDQSNPDGSGEAPGAGQPFAQQGSDWNTGTPSTATAMDAGVSTQGMNGEVSLQPQVRGERSATDGSRTYDINVTCKDTGATSSGEANEQGSHAEMQTCDLFVAVPHDQGHANVVTPPTCGTETHT